MKNLIRILACTFLTFNFFSTTILSAQLWGHYDFTDDPNIPNNPNQELIDRSNNGNNGRFLNSFQYSNDACGSIDNAYSFSGNANVEIAIPPGGVTYNELTLAVSFSVDPGVNASNQWLTLIDIRHEDVNDQLGNRIGVWINPSTMQLHGEFRKPNDGYNYTLIGGTITPGQWHQMVLVVRNNTSPDPKVELYLDCQSVATRSTGPGQLTFTNSPDDFWTIGAHYWLQPRHFMIGKIGDVRIYDRSLNNQEIDDLCVLNCIGTTTCYLDSDGDGFGDPNQVQVFTGGCGANYVTDNTDCDDNDASVYPGAIEVCDGVDNNCNGQIDEGFSNRFFVNVSASGNNDGSTWMNAFNDLQDAIDAAAAIGCGTLEIWVAEGVYLPTRDKDGNSNPTDGRTRTFYIDTDMQIYGGFGGGEQFLRDRNGGPSILSADIDRNDLNTPAQTHVDIIGNNAYRVVRMEETSQRCIMDGFIVTAGNTTSFGGGLIVLANGTSADPVINDCHFTGNQARGGGAVYLNGAGGGSNTTTISQCIFSGNKSTDRAGALYNISASPKVINCLFYDNVGDLGGVAFNLNNTSQPEFINCTFAENTNIRTDEGAAICNYDANVTFINCIFWDNTGAFNTVYQHTSQSTSSFEHCMIEEVSCSTLHDPFLNNANSCTNNYYGQDPIFQNSSFRLDIFSQGINAGTAYLAPLVDLDSIPRPQFSGWDIGAYESVFRAHSRMTLDQGPANSMPTQSTIVPNTSEHTDNLFLTQLNPLNAEQPQFDEQPNLTIYPNPARETVNLRFDNFIDSAISVRIFDAQGKLMINELIGEGNSQAYLNLNKLSAAIYWVEVRDMNGHTWRKKLIKQ